MLKIATRGSKLALWQARHVEECLQRVHGSPAAEFVTIRTTGDRITDVPLSQIGERGLFTKELDTALLQGRADCAVHSLKDLPTALPDGLVIAAILEREDPRDAWLARDGVSTLMTLPSGSSVGTSSMRRRALLLAARPDLAVMDVRGNLDTRLDKLRDGGYDAMILALAGLRRLGREDVVTSILDRPDWLPAPGQGAIAVVAREEDERILHLLMPLQHNDTTIAVTAERSFLRALEGGCQVPIGALADVADDRMTLYGLVSDPDGPSVISSGMEGQSNEAFEIGRDLASMMLRDGADKILGRIRAAAAGPAVSPP